MQSPWSDSTHGRTQAGDQSAIRRAVRRRARGHCEWRDVSAALDWVPTEPDGCPAYGTEAVCYDDSTHPHRWAWLCRPHGTASRRVVV